VKKYEIEFKFEIGDVVVPKIVPPESVQADSWLNAPEIRYHVVKQWAEICPGGIQKLYSIISVRSKGEMGKDAPAYNEELFRLSEPFPGKKP
jgi:hypothetical protein